MEFENFDEWKETEERDTKAQKYGLQLACENEQWYYYCSREEV